MSGVLCLKWNNHTSTFIKSLDILRSKELYCDATIACQGKFFPVHRFVLSTCSEYFEEIFERTQCKHPFIIVKDVEELQLEALLNYMYKGEVNVLQDSLPGLIRAAEALKVKGLAVSEEGSEEKKTVKEKRKSNSSSPLQPKSKRKSDEKFSQQKLAPKSHGVIDDDEISEIPNDNSVPRLGKQSEEEQISKDSTDNSDARSMDNSGLNFQSITESQDNLELQQVDDVKVEPTEIFEAVEENISETVESQSHDNGKEDSLFVSLLSPNNAHSMSEDELPGSNANNHPVPQCSSWNDDVSTNSDKTHDEISLHDLDDIKIEEQEWYSEPSSPMMEEFSPDPNQKKMDDIPTKCPLCSYESKYKTNMKTHIARKHSGIQPFSCTMCKYRSSTKESLKIHIRKHTGEKPYKCKLCPYRAAHYNSIKLHNNIHTTEKPYRCKKCPYRAAQKISLFKHMKIHGDGDYMI